MVLNLSISQRLNQTWISKLEPNLDFSWPWSWFWSRSTDLTTLESCAVQTLSTEEAGNFLQTLAGRLATWPEFPWTWPQLSALAAKRLTISMGKLNRIMERCKFNKIYFNKRNRNKRTKIRIRMVMMVVMMIVMKVMKKTYEDREEDQRKKAKKRKKKNIRRRRWWWRQWR